MRFPAHRPSGNSAELQPVHSDNGAVRGMEMGIIMDKRVTMAETGTCIFRASLKPKLYRDIELPSDRTLYDLAAAIVRAYGFDLDHAFGFFPKVTGNIYDATPRYELFADMGEADGSLSVKRTTVAEAFPKFG
jgi:hypothetical protein